MTSFLKLCREMRPSPRQTIPRASHPLEHLIHAYLTQTSPSLEDKFVLQPRRSLDEYFYTHLQGTGARDAEQVVWRFTSTQQLEPKIFMVDQLWMWILDESECISPSDCKKKFSFPFFSFLFLFFFFSFLSFLFFFKKNDKLVF